MPPRFPFSPLSFFFSLSPSFYLFFWLLDFCLARSLASKIYTICSPANEQGNSRSRISISGSDIEVLSCSVNSSFCFGGRGTKPYLLSPFLFQSLVKMTYIRRKSIPVYILSGAAKNHIICSHFYFSLWIEKTYSSRKLIPVYILSGTKPYRLRPEGALTAHSLHPSQINSTYLIFVTGTTNKRFQLEKCLH